MFKYTMNIAKKKHSCGSVALTTNVFIAQTPSWDVICFPSKKKIYPFGHAQNIQVPNTPPLLSCFQANCGGGGAKWQV